MSKYYRNYSEYLGSQRCCDLRGAGPMGVTGPTGPAAIGPAGTGYTGSTGYTGPTGRGCRGETGPSGPTGPGISFAGLAVDTGINGVWYDPSANALKYSLAKNFIIEHPVDINKYLVHACLEGPEAGVYYRGVGQITDNNSTTIELPYYVEKLATNFTIQITPIYNGKIVILNASEVENNKFNVYGENCKFYWNLTGKRFDINVEPEKNSVCVKGDGPYLYI